MSIPSTEIIEWNDSQYLRKGNTFEQWRKKTNGLKNFIEPQLCKAWVRFSYSGGSISIHASYNIASVQRLSTGRYKIFFSNSIGTNYCVVGSGAQSNTGSGNVSVRIRVPGPTEEPAISTSYVTINTLDTDVGDAAVSDASNLSVVIF